MASGLQSKKRCAFCKKQTLTEVIDFGNMALAGAFLKPEDFPREKKFPLRICFCTHCYVVQVEDDVDPDLLFKNYFYFSSAIRTLREHFTEFAKEVTSRFLPNPEASSVLEIGCNDGVLLSPFANEGVGTVIGVDPAERITATIADSRVHVVNDYFGMYSLPSIKGRFGKVDIVVANNSFAHVSDINGLTEAIAAILKEDGVFIFEVHYLGKVLDEFQYDMMYHEHLYYYSLLALENHLARHNMLIFDLKRIPIHGGSIRFYASKKGSIYSKRISPAVSQLRADERARGYDRAETYQMFASECAKRRDILMNLIASLRSQGKIIAGYGASGRANTIIQYCGIDADHLSYIIDDAPAKHGFYTPGSHFLIRDSSVLKNDPPDYVIIFAWAFFKEIIAKCGDYVARGGRFIVPLPEVKQYPEP